MFIFRMEENVRFDRVEVEQWSLKQLEQWLEEHGLKKTGVKNALINRVLQYRACDSE